MKRKNLLLSILSMCIIFTMILTACGKKENSDTSLVGTWSGQIDMTEYINGQLTESLGDYAQYMTLGTVAMDIDITFTKTEMSAVFHEESIDNLSSVLIEAYTPAVEKMLEDTAAETGISLEEILAETGMTRETFLQETVNAPMERVAEDIKASMPSENTKLNGTYFLENGKITDEKGNAYSYALDGNTLTITLQEGETNYSLKLNKK